MVEFTALEQAVLTSIRDAHPTIAQHLAEFLASASVRVRENSGRGFYTRFDVDRSRPTLGWPERMIDDGLTAEVGAARAGTMLMGFILWLDDGYPACLEGFQYPRDEDVDLRSTGLDELTWIRAFP